MVKPGRRQGGGGGGHGPNSGCGTQPRVTMPLRAGKENARRGARVPLPRHGRACPGHPVFARSSTDLAERDARNKSGHDERSGRTGETARLTQSHANFRIGTLARLSNQGCGLRGDFCPHREGNGLARRRRGRPPPPMGDGRPFSSTRDRLCHESRATNTQSCSAPRRPRSCVQYRRLRCPGVAPRTLPRSRTESRRPSGPKRGSSKSSPTIRRQQ